MGMRETPGSPWLSSAAGLGVAVALRRLFPGDARRGELSLRLADFVLKGQIPSGFFHESFSVEAGRWKGVRGQPGRTLLSLGQSARIAELLLDLADALSGEGRPFEKDFLAALRFVEFFLDEKGRLSMPGSLHLPADRSPVSTHQAALGGLELFFPTAAVYVRTGRDRYKKALDLLVKRFSNLSWNAFQPPCSREGRGPDSAGALLAARLYVRMKSDRYFVEQGQPLKIDLVVADLDGKLVGGRKVAVKVLPKKHAENREFLTRFRREAQATGKLNHVNIVCAYTVGEDQGIH
jgi:serine/threonine protein kinase